MDALTWSSDSKRLAIIESAYISSTDKHNFTLRIYDIASQQQVRLHQFFDEENYNVPLSWSPAVPYLATSVGKVLWLIHAEDERQNYSVKNLFEDVSLLIWSPDGHTLAFQSDYNKIGTWNVDTRTPAIFSTNIYSMMALAWKKDGTRIMILDEKGKITEQTVV